MKRVLLLTTLVLVLGSNMVFQLLLAGSRDAVPVTRDYVAEEERRLAAREKEASF